MISYDDATSLVAKAAYAVANGLCPFSAVLWQWSLEREQYYLHHFLRCQPNLNWHNAEVVAAMLGVADHWLAKGVDGIRLEAITTLVHDRHLRDNPARAAGEAAAEVAVFTANPFLRQENIYTRDRPELVGILELMRKVAESHRPDRFLMAEVGDVDTLKAIAKYSTWRAFTSRSCGTLLIRKPVVFRIL
jgi:alpha-glucosidase